MSRTQQKNHSILLPVIACFAVVTIIVAGFFGFGVIQTRIAVRETVQTNSEIYSDLRTNSQQHAWSFDSFLQDWSEEPTTAEVDELVAKAARIQLTNDELLVDFQLAQNSDIASAPNSQTAEYADSVENFMDAGLDYIQKVDFVISAHQCKLAAEKRYLIAEQEIINSADIDLSNTQTIIDDLQMFQDLVQNAQSESASMIACFDGDFAVLRSDSFVEAITNRVSILQQIEGYIANLIAGVETLNTSQIETASNNLAQLESQLSSAPANPTGESLSRTTSDYFEPYAQAFDGALATLTEREMDLKLQYGID